jgi:peptidoglycan L-alanyl-D-glutamate endopeptidase CwlK
MPKLSEKSLKLLQDAHADLRRLFIEAINYVDFTVVCVHRGKKEQDEAYAKGHSKVKYPNSKHNKLPSLAVDIQPYPISKNKTKNYGQFYYLGGFITVLAEWLYKEGKIKNKIRWGGDWNKNFDVTDNNFNDLYHYEIIE